MINPLLAAGIRRRAVLGGAAALLGTAAVVRPGASEAAAGGCWDIGVLGDSISANGSIGSAWDVRTGGRVVFGDLSYLGHALPLCRGKFRFAGTWASNGITSSEILAKHLPQVLAARPRACVVLVGTNDVGRLSLAQSQSNVRQIVGRLRSAGTTPIMATIPPGDFYTPVQQQQATAFNTWVLAAARANRVRLVDFHAVLTDPATQKWRPGLSSDGGHPTAAGARAMGRALAGVLVAIPGPTATPLLRAYAPQTLLADVLHSRPGTWSLAGQTATGTYSHASSSAWVGAKAVIRSKPYADFNVVGRLTRQPVAGHRLRFTSMVEARSVPGGGRWSCQLIDRTYNLPLVGYSQMTLPLANALGTTSMAWEFVMPSMLPGSDVVVVWSVQGAAGTTMALAQTSLVDLTP